MRARNAWIVGLVLAVVVLAGAAWAIASRPDDEAGPVQVTMYKSTGCVCCDRWKERLEASGFEVRTVASQSVHEVKAEHGVPRELTSCHTAIVEGHVVEGHVPVETVQRFLADRDAPYGIAVPGMPSGSPGMPGEPEPFGVIGFERDEPGEVYASY